MPKFKTSNAAPKGNKEEQKLFTEVIRHYDMAVQDLDNRIGDWDTKDELFRSFIDEDNWPYNSVVFDPRVFTAVFEKTSRLFANKPRGRMVPREGGDILGARINNELLSFEWDDNERVENWPMLAKWAMMDQNCRKYGAAFGLAKWHYETRTETKKDKKGKESKVSVPWYDGPDFKPLVNRDCLPNPSYSTIKLWFQHREYVTLKELKNVNDAAKTKPVYKNLDILEEAIKKEGEGGGDSRAANWTSKNKTIVNVQDQLGQDPYNKIVEVVTEYRNERWITFAPKHGVILRDIPNPYKHGQIPVVMLRYYQVDDDLYGLSEIEPVEKLQKAVNALVNQYLDSVNMSLYTPLKIRSTGGAVQMHTIEFGPAAKWMMNDPATDVIPFQSPISGVTEFASTYRFMIGAMQEALGETSAAISSLSPGQQDKTATEVRDLAVQRNARDNYNQIFLSEALKKQMMFWHTMNQQLLFTDPNEQQKVIRIVGKDALRYFQQRGLDGYGMEEETMEMLTNHPDPMVQEEMDKLMGAGRINPDDFGTPLYPVDTGNEILPKMTMEAGDEMGYLLLEPSDLNGNYDYIPDVESMKIPDEGQMITAKKQMIELLLNPTALRLLQMEGYKPKFKEVMEDFFELLGSKDADKYFEKGGNDGLNAPAGAGLQAGPGPQGVGPATRMGGIPTSIFGGQAQPVVSRPQ
jgi:hypothetical protein